MPYFTYCLNALSFYKISEFCDLSSFATETEFHLFFFTIWNTLETFTLKITKIYQNNFISNWFIYIYFDFGDVFCPEPRD